MLSPSQARIQSFRVTPSLPEPLRPLLAIAQNLWWTWNYEAVDLFAKLDRELWEQCHHNPVAMLGRISQERLERAAHDRSFLHALGTLHTQLQEHVTSRGWYADAQRRAAAEGKPLRIAYFCAEFGLTECLQIYSGGLGGLAGDHLKSAAELGIPLVAVGLLYRKGYFHQYLNPDGYQQETYPDIDAPNQPLSRVMDEKTGRQKRVTIELPGRQVAVAIWRCDVGRVPLYLLDTNLPENAREDRDITANLYAGDTEARIRQELVLGIAGVRALHAVGESPTVVHINEGHAAFCSLERIADVRRAHPDLTFDQAREAVAAGQVFTTHTPVPAGIDRFAPRLIESYLAHMLGPIGLDAEGLLALGRENTADQKEFFSMAVLAIRTSRFCNGVSELHGRVSRSMWRQMWPGTPEPDVPIGHVTNGVHARSWVSGEMTRLYNRYLADRWRLEPQKPESWTAVEEIPDEELWGVHCYRRERLVAWTRRKIREQLVARGAGAGEIERAASALDINALTIGFARRFATYKRATLLFRDTERLKRLLTGDRPVQLLIAGKSHPADGGGKALIREIVTFARASGLSHRIVFLEDYDMLIARRMVQGCDIWLNTPIRGLEASGTSGMKAVLNGGLHCSVLDGWWAEAFNPEVGFCVGRGEDYEDATREEQDDIESRSLYQLLESRVVPEFFDRDESGLPRKWIARMKRSIRHLAPRFNTHRMLLDYADKFYVPAHHAAARLAAGGMREARELSEHVDRLRAHWGGVRVEGVRAAVDPAAAVAVRSPV
ncbi:MAG: alpha-glucan family phosphorylase, partial [Phycisphaeraceae bacterium]|nr:alpha-glucan family phosphorylase [Phycisphaeraceae bacterium]